MIQILVGKEGRNSMNKVFPMLKSAGRLITRIIPRRKNKAPYFRIFNEGSIESFSREPIDAPIEGNPVLRWGSRIPIVAGTNEAVVYNKSASLAKASNKKISREAFIAAGVKTPLLITPETVTATQYPIIARPHCHSKGRDFVTLNNIEEFTTHYNTNRNQWYYSEFINKEREFRVHCGSGKILGIMEKPRSEGTIAWNLALTGEPFVRLKQEDYIFSICSEALKAIDALELDFGGVDVVLLGKKAYVLEVNTAPSISESSYISEQYAKYFDWLNRSQERRPHWNYKEYKSPSSFAWKQAQLAD